MKRGALIRHLSRHGCELVREGGRHSIWRNSNNSELTAVPQHNEIKEFMARKICNDLKITLP
ncbi:type II toxin-antitoxin system HicA family toxin [Candidatus Thiosymbion oneisti]|uniref:type II toxin-antitoxin system HicA family toxin n=1 Tax=Candidatus Thiosymbion oneisti TaxID=589554 RepID=UPI000B7CA174|nr:type II toxin-antitoxin system HicA family toxin [Candidatus Thiosymbion oneisti]